MYMIIIKTKNKRGVINKNKIYFIFLFIALINNIKSHFYEPQAQKFS